MSDTQPEQATQPLEFSPRPGAPRPADFLSALQQAAQSFGFVRLGVAAADAQDETSTLFRHWLSAGHHGAMRYLERPRLAPDSFLPGAKSVLVGAMSYGPDGLAKQPVAAYARGDDYHRVLKQALLQLGQTCADMLGQVVRARACVDSAPLLERAWAVRAGVAFVGKSTLAISPGVGSATLLGELIVDVELPRGEPVQAGCGSCRLCIDACPTRAFVDAYVLDARRCISYLTIEYRGWLPHELRPLMGTHVFGCDICQRVCPFNASRKLPAAAPGLVAREARTGVDLVGLLELSSGDYRRLVKGSAMRRASRPQLQRNAAVALGNAGDPAGVGPLGRTLVGNARALVRGHAAWALGRLATPAARSALEAAARLESDPDVQREIELGLVAAARAG